MKRELSEAQERVVLSMSAHSGGTGECTQKTLQKLEIARIIKLFNDRWVLTDAGKIVASTLRKYKPVGPWASLLDKHQRVFERKPLEVHAHDLQYIGEKIRALFGPLIDASPETKKAFSQALIGSISSP